MPVPTVTLNDGNHIPLVGFGTFAAEPGQVGAAVTEAVKNAGYRHLDFAKVYHNQKEISAALRECAAGPNGVPRSELFLTSKLWNNAHRPELVEKALDDTLSELGVDYLDLYLVHWPIAFANADGDVASKTNDAPDADNKVPLDLSTTLIETWKTMVEVKKTNKVKSIGVSNYSPAMIDAIVAATGVVPAVNQVERHPRLSQRELITYAASKGIHLTAYSPLGNNTEGLPLLTEHPDVKRIAEHHKASGAQVLVAWGMAEGISVLVKSVTPSRIKDNITLIHLSPEEKTTIDHIGQAEPKRFLYPYDYRPVWDINVFGEPKEAEATHHVNVGS